VAPPVIDSDSRPSAKRDWLEEDVLDVPAFLRRQAS